MHRCHCCSNVKICFCVVISMITLNLILCGSILFIVEILSFISLDLVFFKCFRNKWS